MINRFDVVTRHVFTCLYPLRHSVVFKKWTASLLKFCPVSAFHVELQQLVDASLIDMSNICRFQLSFVFFDSNGDFHSEKL